MKVIPVWTNFWDNRKKKKKEGKGKNKWEQRRN